MFALFVEVPSNLPILDPKNFLNNKKFKLFSGHHCLIGSNAVKRIKLEWESTQCAKDCGSNQRTLNVPGITQYLWVPANQCCFSKQIIFLDSLFKTGKSCTQRYCLIPGTLSVPCSNCVYKYGCVCANISCNGHA